MDEEPLWKRIWKMNTVEIAITVAGLLVLSVWVQLRVPERAVLAFGLWCAAVGVLLGYLLLALWFPSRSLHDRLAGTYLVPR